MKRTSGMRDVAVDVCKCIVNVLQRFSRGEYNGSFPPQLEESARPASPPTPPQLCFHNVSAMHALVTQSVGRVNRLDRMVGVTSFLRFP